MEKMLIGKTPLAVLLFRLKIFKVKIPLLRLPICKATPSFW
jgi:hypothetical protein